MARKKTKNWTAIIAIVGILSLLSGIGFGIYQIMSEKSPTPSIETSGKNSPVIVGNKGPVNVNK